MRRGDFAFRWAMPGGEYAVGFYRWKRFPSWESALVFFDRQLFDGRNRRSASAQAGRQFNSDGWLHLSIPLARPKLYTNGILQTIRAVR
jgi:hypothetical protein